MSAVRSPLLDMPGAVPASEPDQAVAGHYGDPLGEQRLLASGDGFVDLSHRGVVQISGPDRLRWLNDLTTQRLIDLPAQTGTETLVLSPNGHVEHHLMLVDDGTTTWVHVEPGTAGGLVDFLSSMRFLLRVEVRDVTDDWAVVWQPVDQPHPEFPTRVDPRADALHGRELFIPRKQFLTVIADFGRPAGIAAWNALRIEAGRPRFGVDTDHRSIPHELGWIGFAVHLNKGCYRGQETVAHVANLGRPPRRLVRLHLDGSVREQLPAKGAQVLVAGTVAGHLTSAAYHHELGPIALALVRYAVDDSAAAVVRDADGTDRAATIEPIVRKETEPPPGQRARMTLRAGLSRRPAQE